MSLSRGSVSRHYRTQTLAYCAVVGLMEWVLAADR